METKDARDGRDQRDGRDGRDARDSRDAGEPRDERGGSGHREAASQPSHAPSHAPSPARLADELQKLSEAILWKNHRATQEVKDAVKIVAAELVRTAENLKDSAPALAAVRDEATVQGHLALLEAKDKLALLDDLVRNALQGAHMSPTFIGETARLKLALARMEAADLFEEKRRLLLEERRRVEAMNARALRELEARLSEIASASTH